MVHADLVHRLTEALRHPLPGPEAQARMAPRLRGDWPSGVDSSRPRHAAGLLLVFPVAGQAHVVLTVRSDRVRHSGQVSLPGGVVEPGETFEAAALREAHEEVALDPDRVQVLGRLTPLDIPVSGFRLHPIVAAVDERPRLRASDHEVARILEVPVATLLHPAALTWRPIIRGDLRLEVPTFVVEGEAIWGATAMVLAEFLALMG